MLHAAGDSLASYAQLSPSARPSDLRGQRREHVVELRGSSERQDVPAPPEFVELRTAHWLIRGMAAPRLVTIISRAPAARMWAWSCHSSSDPRSSAVGLSSRNSSERHTRDAHWHQRDPDGRIGLIGPGRRPYGGLTGEAFAQTVSDERDLLGIDWGADMPGATDCEEYVSS